MTFLQVLENEEGKKLIEQIEELYDAKDQTLIRIKNQLIKELKDEFNYQYL